MLQFDEHLYWDSNKNNFSFTPPLVTWLKGQAIWENHNTNPWYKLARPKEMWSFFRVVGDNQSRINYILAGLTWTPFSLMMYPKYWTWVIPKFHFSKLAHNLCCCRVWRSCWIWWRFSSQLWLNINMSSKYTTTNALVKVTRCYPSVSWRFQRHSSIRTT